MLPSVAPGYLHTLLPTEIPEQSESWKDVMEDFNKVIMPGITHWQSPNFHAYYPTQTSYPAIVGDIIASGLGVVGFSWVRVVLWIILVVLFGLSGFLGQFFHIL